MDRILGGAVGIDSVMQVAPCDAEHGSGGHARQLFNTQILRFGCYRNDEKGPELSKGCLSRSRFHLGIRSPIPTTTGISVRRPFRAQFGAIGYLG